MRKNKILENFWLKESGTTITKTKHLLANASIVVRSDQFNFFINNFNPNPNSRVLDVGVSSDETLKDSNMFEKLYKWPKKLTMATIENPIKLNKLYPLSKTIKIIPHKKLPFKDKYFDFVVSWATLEHVGGYSDQEYFLNELLRVGKKIFVTTPYRGCIYEPHTGLPFLQWLPLRMFRKFCKVTNNKYWSTEKNLNPLFVHDVADFNTTRKLIVKIYRMFGFLPSHLLIYSK